MSFYRICGRVIVERKDDGKEYEILSANASTDYALWEGDEHDDLQTLIFSEKDVPSEPGLYILMYGAKIAFTQDYFGEWDVADEIGRASCRERV